MDMVGGWFLVKILRSQQCNMVEPVGFPGLHGYGILL